MNRYSVADFWGYLVVCGALAACDKAKPTKLDTSTITPSSAVSASNATGALARSPQRQETAPPPQNPRDFGAMFQNEADNRPAGTIKAEVAMEAFRKDGVVLEAVRQHLARPYGARYCVGAKVTTEIALSVCEYIDAEAATTGAESSRKLVLANREIQLNHATTLTVREIEKSPAADAVAKKLFASFAKLTP